MADFLCPSCHGSTWEGHALPLTPELRATLDLAEAEPLVCPSCVTASVYLRPGMSPGTRKAVMVEARAFQARTARANREAERGRIRKLLADTATNRRHYSHPGRATFTLYTWEEIPNAWEERIAGGKKTRKAPRWKDQATHEVARHKVAGLLETMGADVEVRS